MPGQGTNVGTGFVRIRPDVAGFGTELGTKLAPQVKRAGDVVQQGLAGSLTKAGTGLAAFGKRLDNIGRNFIFTGRTMTNYLTLPLVGLGAVAVHAANDFDQAFTKVAAITSLAGKNVTTMRSQVLELAGATAQAPTDLANALYFVASAGLRASQIMPVLRNSAKAAAVGLGDTQTVAQTLIFALNNYAKSGLTATHATDLLVAAVKAGTAEPDQFAGALGRVLPVAAKAKVGFDQIVASLASLSNIGLDVNEGTTALRGVLRSLLVPTQAAKDKLKELGLSATQVRNAIAQQGLLGAMQLLNKATGGNIESLGKIIPNVRALTGLFGLTGQNAAQVAKVFDEVKNSTGALDKAFRTTAKDPSFQFRQSLVQLQKLGIELGNTILPSVTKAFSGLVHALESMSPASRDLLIKIATIAVAIGPASLLVGGLTRLISLPVRIVGGLLKMAGALGIMGRAATGAAEGTAAAAAATGEAGLAGSLGALGGLLTPGGAVLAGLAALTVIAIHGAIETKKWNAEVQNTAESFTTFHRRMRDVLADVREWNATQPRPQNIPGNLPPPIPRPRLPAPPRDQAPSASDLISQARNLSALSKFAGVLANLRTQVVALTGPLDKSAVAQLAFLKSQAQAAIATGDTAKAAGIAAREYDILHGILITVGGNWQQYTNVLSEAQGMTVKQRGALDKMLAKVYALEPAIKGSTAAHIRNALAVGDVDTAMALLRKEYDRIHPRVKRHSDATKKVSDRTTELKDKSHGLAGALGRQADKHRAAATAADEQRLKTEGLTKALGNVPTDVTTHVHLPDIKVATSAVLFYNEMLRNIPTTITTRFRTAGNLTRGEQQLGTVTGGAHGLVFDRVPRLYRGGRFMVGPGGAFVAADGNYGTPVGRKAEIVSQSGVMPLGPKELDAVGVALWSRRPSARRPQPIVLVVQINRRELSRQLVNAYIEEN